MRQITKLAVQKFLNAEDFSNRNTKVEAGFGCVRMYLHDNEIATKIGNREYIIDTCGWFSDTTKERLNGLLDALGKPKIYQKNFEWFLMDKKWNGSEIRLKKNDWEYVRK